jgi:hypothetical protein
MTPPNGYTPGPWRVFIDDSGGQWSGWPLSIEAVNEADKTVVRPGGQWPYEWDAKTSQHEAVANAKLIALAPEMASEIARLSAELAKAQADRDDWEKAAHERSAWLADASVMVDERTAERNALAKAGRALVGVVEGIQGAMEHGTFRAEKGMRLKDTPEWVAFYVALARLAP